MMSKEEAMTPQKKWQSGSSTDCERDSMTLPNAAARKGKAMNIDKIKTNLDVADNEKYPNSHRLIYLTQAVRDLAELVAGLEEEKRPVHIADSRSCKQARMEDQQTINDNEVTCHACLAKMKGVNIVQLPPTEPTCAGQPAQPPLVGGFGAVKLKFDVLPQRDYGEKAAIKEFNGRGVMPVAATRLAVLLNTAFADGKEALRKEMVERMRSLIQQSDYERRLRGVRLGTTFDDGVSAAISLLQSKPAEARPSGDKGGDA